MPISPEKYVQQRDALVEELRMVADSINGLRREDEDLNLAELDKKQQEIRAISRRVYEDQFKFVLIAQSQGGKSTTFNAIAGGGVLSPMGNAALKCSAAPLVLMNVMDERDIGAYVYLRPDEDLVGLCAELLGAEILGRSATLSNPQALAKARHEHQRLVEEWRGSKKSISDEQRDLLFSVGLILGFYDAPAVRRLYTEVASSPQGALRRSLVQAGRMARFPDNFIQRYAKGDPRDFQPEEVFFPFISRVVCKIASENLRRIGARVVDSPGLFANNTDTRVAMAEIHDADAVWYLLDARQVSEYEKRAIRECSAICGDRIFFSVNMKGNLATRDFVVRQIIPPIAEEIRSLGGDVTQEQVYSYHALLALLAMQGPAILSGTVDASVQQFLLQICENRGFDVTTAPEDWEMLAGDLLRGLSPRVERQFAALPKKLSPDGIDFVRRESGFDQILTRIEEYVVARKALSILIDRGAARAVSLLQMVEQSLASREATVGKNVEESKRKFDEAETKLKEIGKFAKLVLEPLEGDLGVLIDTELAKDLYENMLLPRLAEVAKAAAPEIREIVRVREIAKTIKGWIFDDGKLIGAQCRDIVQAKLESELEPGFAVWSARLEDGKNGVFNSLVLDRARVAAENIRQRWAATIGRDELLKGLPAPPPFHAEIILDRTSLDSAVEGTHVLMKTFGQIAFTILVSVVPGPTGILRAS